MMSPGFDALQGRIGSLLGSVRDQNAANELDTASMALRTLARSKGAEFSRQSYLAQSAAEDDAIRSAATSNLIGAGIGALGSIAGSAIRSSMANRPSTDKFSADYGQKIDRYSTPLTATQNLWS